MTGAEDRAALAELLAAAISYCEREIASMNAYDEGEHWRGLATDEWMRLWC